MLTNPVDGFKPELVGTAREADHRSWPSAPKERNSPEYRLTAAGLFCHRGPGRRGPETSALHGPENPYKLRPLAFEDEKREALTMLNGIVEGAMTPDESFALLDKADPTLVYFILKWIKKHFHREHERVEEVRGRLSNVTANYRSLTRRAKAGEADPVVEWFEGTHRYRELPADEFIDIVIEKLEG